MKTVRTKTRRIDAPLEGHELLRIAEGIVAHNPLALFTTVDEDEVPRSRWMVAIPAGHGLCGLYALTGRHSRKLRDIRANPAVCWVFTGPKHEDVVTITGSAVALPTLDAVEESWRPLMEATQQYAMNALTNTAESNFVALLTATRGIEIVSPRLGIYTPHPVPFYQPAAGG
ncbi:MAG: pyridoxamine 5'-phosphate oxidase family protein [Planctomycetota bacterium]|nr:pyridoxamine 5'-phosphate oxidase family protein [Planctomycetota bacterium]